MRKSLPIFAYREALLEAIAEHQVSAVDVSVRCDVGVSAGVWCGCVCRGVVWVCLQGCGVGVSAGCGVGVSAGVWCGCVCRVWCGCVCKV